MIRGPRRLTPEETPDLARAGWPDRLPLEGRVCENRGEPLAPSLRAELAAGDEDTP